VSEAAIGIDLGGSSIKSVAVTVSGEIVCQRSVDFSVERPLEWAGKIGELASELAKSSGLKDPRVGLSAPGLAASNGRSIAHMPGRLQGLERLDWTEFLQSPTPVPVLNDAHAALVGETWIGAGAGCANAFMLTLGTGVGGAAIVDGRLLRGAIGRAGHLGHICLDIDGTPDITGTPGSLELMIGNCSIQERSGGRFRSTHELVDAYRAGDEGAAAIWLRSLRALACSIASLINVLDPELVIIGGGIAAAGDALFGPLRDSVASVEWRAGGHKVRIVPAQLREFAGAIGAARNAF